MYLHVENRPVNSSVVCLKSDPYIAIFGLPAPQLVYEREASVMSFAGRYNKRQSWIDELHLQCHDRLSSLVVAPVHCIIAHRVEVQSCSNGGPAGIWFVLVDAQLQQLTVKLLKFFSLALKELRDIFTSKLSYNKDK